MAKIIAFVSNKGGTGKTSSTINVGHSLADQGKKVLLVDLDAQANLSQAHDIEEPDNHVGKVLLKEIPISKAIVKGGVDVLPAASGLLEDEERLSAKMNREQALRKALNELNIKYDFILLDTPPSLGLMTNNALVACDEYVITVVAEYFSYTGIRRVIKHVHDNDIEARLAGVLLTRFNPNQRARVMQAMAGKLKASELHVFNTSIRSSVRVVESQLMKQSLLEYDREATATQDYLKFSTELINA